MAQEPTMHWTVCTTMTQISIDARLRDADIITWHVGASHLMAYLLQRQRSSFPQPPPKGREHFCFLEVPANNRPASASDGVSAAPGWDRFS
jgi:hypothetical protein